MDENRADCWSVTTGVEQGWFGSADFPDLVQAFKDNPGDLNHPPGNERIANMKKCIDDAEAGRGTERGAGGTRRRPGASYLPDAPPFDNDVLASGCAYWDTVHEKINWNKKAQNPSVEYQIPYENRCDKAIECLVKVGVGDRPRGETDYENWTDTYHVYKVLTIPPHKSAAVKGILIWNTDEALGTKPSLRNATYADDDKNWELECKFTH